MVSAGGFLGSVSVILSSIHLSPHLCVLKFQSAESFTSDLSGWEVQNVLDFSYMFNGASSCNSDISAWEPVSATTMRQMFSNAALFDTDISGWTIDGVTDMFGQFYGASSFDQDLCPWGSRLPATGVDVEIMFEGSNCPEKSSPIENNLSLGPWCHQCN